MLDVINPSTYQPFCNSKKKPHSLDFYIKLLVICSVIHSREDFKALN